MTRVILSMACGLAVALAACGEASAQQRGQGGRGGFGGFGGFGGGGFGGGKTSLVRSEQVQTELKLSDEQKTKLAAVGDKLREDTRALVPSDTPRDQMRQKFEETRDQRAKLTAEAEKKIDEILTADQTKRLDEISLQQRGLSALTDEKVAGKLGLSADQQTKIKGILDEQQTKFREAFPRPEAGQRPDFSGVREKMEKLRTETTEQVNAVLTSEQQTKFTALKGTAFEMRRGGPGGERRPGGEGGNRPRRPNTNNEL